MATLAAAPGGVQARGDRFFILSAILMALVMVAGFSFQLAMGRSSFNAAPLTHAHGIVFFGWVVLFVVQTMLGTTGALRLHRTLGWIAAGWMVAMVILGIAITVARTRAGTVPFFFTPQYFLIANPMTVLGFAGLTIAAIVNRRRPEWHKRLHLCGMAMLLGPGFGRLLPLPFMIPWAFESAYVVGLVFPIAGMIADLRRSGRVHPAWWWGMAALVGTMLAWEVIAYSTIGDAIHAAVTAGTPGAAIAPLDYPPFPPMA
ncbi:hypothetical protein NYR55_00135 [Sphingomonas sp. BGYR3]|uniref:hypothetical protein n=1 Tax=Sphingomonas sp. BGYR3 TaxID=2975483 RepID=UPI0021A601FD|nr:hypothetical protein [Sphingomonas sp. BGYR3]MDG5487036.1 hypothetical protein [Sphingomonas sp. BGYR3]